MQGGNTQIIVIFKILTRCCVIMIHGDFTGKNPTHEAIRFGCRCSLQTHPRRHVSVQTPFNIAWCTEVRDITPPTFSCLSSAKQERTNVILK